MLNYPKNENEFLTVLESGMLWKFFPETGETFASFMLAYPNYDYSEFIASNPKYMDKVNKLITVENLAKVELATEDIIPDLDKILNPILATAQNLQAYDELAEIQWTHFASLITEGFTHLQALEIVKTTDYFGDMSERVY